MAGFRLLALFLSLLRRRARPQQGVEVERQAGPAVVVAGRASSSVFGSLGRSRTGAALLGMVTATIMVITQWGWMNRKR